MVPFRDFKNNLVEKIALPLAVYTADQATPTGVDMLQGDGLCAVAVYLGVLNDATTCTITVEESDDNTTFTAVTLDNSGTLTFVGTDDNTVLRASFQRSKRYVRTPVDLSGTISAGMLIVIQEPKKYVY